MMYRLCAQSMAACLFVSAIGFNSSAAELENVPWQKDYARAQQTRMEKKQPMVVFLTMDGCRHCYRMLSTTYKDDRVSEKIRAKYVATIVNATHQQDLANRFGARIYPTTILVGPDNRIVDRIEGYVPAKELVKRLSVVTARYGNLAQSPVRRASQ